MKDLFGRKHVITSAIRLMMIYRIYSPLLATHRRQTREDNSTGSIRRPSLIFFYRAHIIQRWALSLFLMRNSIDSLVRFCLSSIDLFLLENNISDTYPLLRRDITSAAAHPPRSMHLSPF